MEIGLSDLDIIGLQEIKGYVNVRRIVQKV